MAKRLKIGVFMGGPSVEHEVSLATGVQIMANLNPDKYSVVAVKISKSGRWMANGRYENHLKIFKMIDLAFLALHGEVGEDGRMQGLLDFHGVPYTGSGRGPSALAMDKLHSREIFKLAGISTPKTLHLKKGENNSSLVKFFTSKVVKLPVFVKPRFLGSSVGVYLVDTEKKLFTALESVFKLDKDALIEEYIKGTEVACGVLENFSKQKHFVLPLTQIQPVRAKFFDYKAKYQQGASKEITPAPVDAGRYKKAQSVALLAHQLLGCRSYSRSDMILRNGAVYLLEVNTLPGLTPTSLFPQQAVAAGLSFPQLLDKIIENANSNF
ncbi:MAG: D-alanine--D-alanine ligase [Candidatus Yanofskybacteria bacterium]|nr:D-alanine--D-alanine ligase [Candidatus Yanofskybacteria bacterium]